MQITNECEAQTMKLKELLDGLEILETTADPEMDITGICCDSREAEAGSLFVAVKGFESDGHRFIPAAAEKGAACVLCEDAPACAVPYVRVADTRRAEALAAAAFYGRPAEKLRLVGVTGTNGKTTTTMLVKQMLEQLTGAKVGLIGTIQNMIGGEVLHTERTTPDAISLQKLFRQMVDAGCIYAVMEVSSHALALDRVYGVPFEVGVFTNLTRDHLDFHKTMDAYCAAKAILFSQCKKGVVNLDDAYAQQIISLAKCPVYTCSASNDAADLVARNIRLDHEGVQFCVLTTGRLEKTKLGIPGRFSVYNGLAAIAVAVQLGLDLGDAARALENCRGVCGRAEVVPTGRDFSVIIDYAHTPDALENILNTVQDFAKGRVVTLVGCGGDRDKTKRPMMGKIAADLADFVVITSDNPRTEDPMAIINDILPGMKGTKTPYKVIENRREAIFWAVEHAQPGDVIVLAGKGHETYQVIGREKHHFDEREIVAEALQAC